MHTIKVTHLVTLTYFRVTSTVEGLRVSDMAYVTFNDTGSSVMLLGAAWLLYPGGRYWGSDSCESSLQASLGRVMLEDLLICHYFVIVKFYA